MIIKKTLFGRKSVSAPKINMKHETESFRTSIPLFCCRTYLPYPYTI